MPEWHMHGMATRRTLREATALAAELWDLQDPERPLLRWRGRVQPIDARGFGPNGETLRVYRVAHDWAYRV